MMKTFGIVSALALAGIAFAGTAAAECPQQGALGVFDYDYASICVLESQSYEYPPFYSYSYDSVASNYLYGYNTDGTYVYTSGDIASYDGESCWGSCYTYGGTQAYQYMYGCQQVAGCNDLYAGAGQYFGSGPGYNYEGTYVNLGGSAAGEYAYLYYYQQSFNGDCNESGYVYSSALGFVELMPYQACGVAVPLLELPEL